MCIPQQQQSDGDANTNTNTAIEHSGPAAARAFLVGAKPAGRPRPLRRHPTGERRASGDVGCRANAIIEMVLVMPILLMFMLGMIEFSLYLFTKSVFESAARDAARSACTAVAVQTDPNTAASRVFGYSNVPFQSSWMTIYDCSTAAYVTDVSSIAAGHAFTVTIQQTYDQLPNAYRPLHDFTGAGIRNGKVVIGKCTAVKE